MKKPFFSCCFFPLLRLVLLLFCVTLVAYILVVQTPTDYVQYYVGVGEAVSVEQKEAIQQQLGLDTHPVTAYFQWLSQVLQGNLGQSLLYRKPVVDVIAERLGNSLLLLCSAWVLSGVLGLILGLMMGLYPNKPLDKCFKTLCLVLSSTPTFLVAVFFIFLFSVTLQWFPIGFSAPVGVLAEEVTWLQKLHHMVLPTLTLSSVSCCHIALHTRESTLKVMESEYILFAKSRNISNYTLLRTHALRNLLLPSVTLQFASFSELLGTSVLAETAFSYGGLGNSLVLAGLQGDVPLLLGISLLCATLVFVGNTIANLLALLIDPRVGQNTSSHV